MMTTSKTSPKMGGAPLRIGRRGQSGLSLIEVAVAASLLSLVLTTALSVFAIAARANDRNRFETGLVGGARVAMDEALGVVRAAGTVYGQQTISSTTYSASSSQLVISAPGYDPSSTNYFLDGISDYTILKYDSTNQQLLETMVPGTGSVRPSRQDMVIARNVTSCTFSYLVREDFTSSAANNAKFNLTGQPNSTPKVYINGVLTTVSFSQNNTAFTLNLSLSSNDIQVVYYINPTTDNTAMGLVCEVEIALQLTTLDRRLLTVTSNINGAARLRNARQ